MEHYLVSARKYRPSTFKSVVGQKALTTTLRNAVAQGRLAHSYLFCGSRGVGKTSCARIFAKAINCEHPVDGEPCNECDSCRAFNRGQSLNIIELDAASNNGVDNIRELVDMTRNPPSTGRYRVFIVDEVHMLSPAAFNAFLKTLEEPPEYVVFILATTEKHKILPTILSRCQIYDFSRITIQDMIDHMTYVAAEEGIKVEPAALNVIARQADGAMRDALSIFDQVAASSERNITYQSAIDSLNVLDRSYYSRLLDCFVSGDVLGSWLIYREIRDKGFDSHFFLNGLAEYFRDLMVAQSERTLHLVEAGDDVRAELAKEGTKVSAGVIYRAMSLLNDADLHYREAANKQFLTELTLAKICQLSSPSPDDSGSGEGQKLKPITAPMTPASTAAPQPEASAPRPTQAAAPTATAAPAAAVPPAAPAQKAPESNHTLIPMNGGAPQPPRQMAPPAPRPRPKGITMSPLGTMNLKPTAQTPATAPTAPRESRPSEAATLARTSPFTDAALTQAWDAFAAANPREAVLQSTLRTSRPHRESPDATTLTVTVENEFQGRHLTQWLPKLLSHLHDALDNDAVTIDIRINDGEAPPAVWSEREVLEHLRGEHPELNNYIKDFGLTLS